MARPDRGVWSVVRAAAAGFVLVAGLERPDLVAVVLCAGPVLQLSALHGDDLPRISSGGRFPKVSRLYRPHHGAGRPYADAVALLAALVALDLHYLSDLEPVALQRAELRPVHDVCPPRGRRAGKSGAKGAVWRVHRVVPDSVPWLPHGHVNGSLVHLDRDSPSHQPVGADHPRRGIRRT